MEIRSGFTIPAPPDEAYRFLLDLERVGPCIPGGEVGARAADGSYPARVTVKLGPMRLVYEGTARIEEADPAVRRAVLSAEAREARGQGSARTTMAMTIGAENGGSQVEVVTELTLTGRAAQMGRGVVDEVARRLVADMATCLEQRLTGRVGPEAPAPAKPGREERRELRGGRLLLSVLWGKLTALLGRRR